MECRSCLSSLSLLFLIADTIKRFARSETKECSVLESSTPQSLQLNVTQHYVFKSPIPFKKEGAEKTLNSKLTLNMNAQGLIEEHIEEWEHEPNKDADDGFMGKIQEYRKKMDAKMVESGVSSDPNKI